MAGHQQSLAGINLAVLPVARFIRIDYKGFSIAGRATSTCAPGGVDPKRWGVFQHDRRENESFIARVFFLVRETGGYGRRYSPMQCPNALPNHR